MAQKRKRARPKIVIIAGPNGAGKTTFAEEYLVKEAGFPEFLNADLIARGLSPFAPEKAALQAGKVMLAEIDRRVRTKKSFAFETTLSGRNYVRRISSWTRAGYHVQLIFLSLPTVELAVERVKARVSQGGHHIPEQIVRRRFAAGLKNLDLLYRKLVDSWIVYDNSGTQPRKLMEGGR